MLLPTGRSASWGDVMIICPLRKAGHDGCPTKLDAQVRAYEVRLQLRPRCGAPRKPAASPRSGSNGRFPTSTERQTACSSRPYPFSGEAQRACNPHVIAEGSARAACLPIKEGTFCALPPGMSAAPREIIYIRPASAHTPSSAAPGTRRHRPVHRPQLAPAMCIVRRGRAVIRPCKPRDGPAP